MPPAETPTAIPILAFFVNPTTHTPSSFASVYEFKKALIKSQEASVYISPFTV